MKIKKLKPMGTHYITRNLFNHETFKGGLELVNVHDYFIFRINCKRKNFKICCFFKATP